MITKQRSKVLIGGAVLVAGTAIIGGAFTAGGLANTSNDGFIGGSNNVTIVGATMTNVDYAITAGDIDSFEITFGAVPVIVARAVSVALFDATPVQLAAYSCTAIAATTYLSTCTPTGAKATASAVETVKFTVQN